MRRLYAVALLAFGLAACGQPGQAPAPTAPPQAPALPSEMSVRDTLVDCAGAIAAEGAVDPMADPSTGSAAENTYFTVLARMDKEPGLAGASGREAARTARDAWIARPAGERTARAAECATRFAG